MLNFLIEILFLLVALLIAREVLSILMLSDRLQRIVMLLLVLIAAGWLMEHSGHLVR